MIDIDKETLIPIRDVPKLLPRRQSGKKIHLSVLYRWMAHGVRGVRLESIRIGGTTYTSKEALQRFADQCSNSRARSSAVPPPTTATRQRQIERAAREVARLLGTDSKRR